MELTKEQVFKFYEAAGYIGYNTYRLIESKNLGKLVIMKLRKFEDMTEEEHSVIVDIYNEDYRLEIVGSGSFIATCVAQTPYVIYLLSIGIDLFGAIEKGWAERIVV